MRTGTGRYRGAVLACTDTSNDPRVSGSATYTWEYDGWARGAHVQWGTGRLENAGGAWDGTMTGSYSIPRGDVLLFWFKGSGGYEGLSYAMWAVLSPAEVAWTYPVDGIIFPGSPPAPKPGEDAAMRQAATGSPGPAATSTAVPGPASPEPTPEPYDYGPATIVSGTEACAAAEGTETVAADGTRQSRGWILTCTDTSNDPRVSGSVTYSWNYDMWGSDMRVRPRAVGERAARERRRRLGRHADRLVLDEERRRYPVLVRGDRRVRGARVRDVGGPAHCGNELHLSGEGDHLPGLAPGTVGRAGSRAR